MHNQFEYAVVLYCGILQVIEVLWELSHRDDLSRELVDKALDEMYHIMVDSTVMKDSYKRKYLDRCIDSIKKGELSSLYNIVVL